MEKVGSKRKSAVEMVGVRPVANRKLHQLYGPHDAGQRFQADHRRVLSNQG